MEAVATNVPYESTPLAVAYRISAIEFNLDPI
ncbi:unnamed protein product [Chondrus crispus]|uniref:Uncharacterized protein n=1 Tax=Chondrus crispus TaxID=2769 RepID=R7QGE6_CHOCR|nr:unnamed protein product [Chondrus crispus]CDF37602.1 unnamed protein product [Chondrus crispus]|eukprot:XP_005717473.1 unnamed protein product [Chondrus crispus]